MADVEVTIKLSEDVYKDITESDFETARVIVRSVQATITDAIRKGEKLKTGHWIKPRGIIKPFGEDTVQCDICGFFTDVDNNYNFCPICRARMKNKKSEGELINPLGDSRFGG